MKTAPTSPCKHDVTRAAQLVESVVGNAWAADPDGTFTYVTSTALSLLGMTLEDLVAASDEDTFAWARVIHPADREAAGAAWRHSLESGDHYDVEHRMLRAAGDYGWVRCSGQPLRDDEGRITGWYGTLIRRDARSSEAIDVESYEKTEEALRERERELSHLVDMVPSHVWRLTADAPARPSSLRYRSKRERVARNDRAAARCVCPIHRSYGSRPSFASSCS